MFTLQKFICLFIFICGQSVQAQAIPLPAAQTPYEEVQIPEVYELGNIILALTEYGISDRYEVSKRSKYYQDVMKYFAPMQGHPLLKLVNYSRKEWDKYLCFRTDAFAYSFNPEGKIVRTLDFSSMTGLDEFSRNLELIQDFAEKSKFRAFFQENTHFYQGIISSYISYNQFVESKEFLDKVFTGERNSKSASFIVILSPLVGRMNCLRPVNDSTNANFVPVPDFQLQNTQALPDPAQQLIDVHAVFTELDHGYVNPLTESKSMRKIINRKFNSKKWHINSGYTGINCYNEYLTWALYDLYLDSMHIETKDSLMLQYHFLNSDRGFFASNVFASTLLDLYRRDKDKLSFRNILIQHLDWCDSIQNYLVRPEIIGQKYDSAESVLTLNFNTSMRPVDHIDCAYSTYSVQDSTYHKVGNINLSGNQQIRWVNDKMLKLFFPVSLPVNSALLFNWWGTAHPMYDQHGVLLKVRNMRIRY